MADFNKEIFDKKTFSELLNDIYNNSKKKEKQIKDLIDDLKTKMNNPGDVVILVPLLQKYLELGIKNDDQLLKMASIVQKAMIDSKEEEVKLDSKEREALFNLAKETSVNITESK